MRRVAQQEETLAQGLAHQIKIESFQITQSAVDEFGRFAGGPGGEIIFFKEGGLQAIERGHVRDRRAVDPAADDQHIVSAVGELGDITHENVARPQRHQSHTFL